MPLLLLEPEAVVPEDLGQVPEFLVGIAFFFFNLAVGFGLLLEETAGVGDALTVFARLEVGFFFSVFTHAAQTLQVLLLQA